MTIVEKMAIDDANLIPDEDKPYINIFRKYIRDDSILNVLTEEQENTDIDLYQALLLTLDNINNAYQPKLDNNKLSDVKSITLLLLGATLQILISAGILSARNTLTYRDAGGITVQDYDKYGRYVNYFNILVNKFNMKLVDYKRSQNLDDGYGGVPSEYFQLY
jgi:hypothetical protein